FGSRATGTNTVTSDVDIALFGGRLTLTDQARLAAALDKIPMAQSVDLMLYDSIESQTLREHIRRQGIEWYARTTRDEECDTALGSPSLLDCLPPDWERSTLGAACERGGGNIQTGPFGSQLHASDYRPVGIPSIMPQNLGDNRVIEDGIARVGERDANRLTRYLVRAGDIVYSRRGDVERRALIGPREDGWLCGTGCLRVRLGENCVFPRYASYYLGHPVVREWIVRHAHGATMQNLNTAILSACPFVIPPISEQRSIAHILGTLDDRIELNRRMNETLEAMARALFKSWFVDFDPVRAKMEGRDTGLPKEIADLFPNRLVDSELGDIPEGWQVRPLSECIDVDRGLSYKGSGLSPDGLPMHNLNSVYEGGGYKDDGIKHYDGEHKPRHVVQPTDVIVANTEQGHDRLLIGYAAVVPARYVPMGLFSHHLYRVRPKGSVNLGPDFICRLLNTRAMHDTISGYATGTTVNMLPVDALKLPSMVVPSMKVMVRFSVVAEAVRYRREILVEESRTLAAIRDALLPKLVSGKLRVKGTTNLRVAPIA
ncbi:MAG: restriction endonuclease subunit S, partial [Gemmatimonadetes bacterium]|nr:restriction endonuclease subunit S [Gemmatimonadota bacterium]